MGGKRIGERKFIYLCIANLFFFISSGCYVLKERFEVRNEFEVGSEKSVPSANLFSEHLARAKDLLREGDYEGSLLESQKALSSGSKNSPVDEVLFHMALIYSHFGNPKRDIGKSLSFLKKLIQDYPLSPLVEEARVMSALIQENERLNQTIKKTNYTIDRLIQTIEKLHQVIEESKQVDIEIEEKKREKGK